MFMGGKRYDREIISPDDAAKIDNVFVIAVVGNPLPIVEQFNKKGVECIHISELHFSYYEKGTDLSWIKKAKPKIEKALNLFADEKSRDVFSSIFCNKLLPSRKKTAMAGFL